MPTLAALVSRVMGDFFGATAVSPGLPLSNRNYIVDGNMEQMISAHVVLGSGANTYAAQTMFKIWAGAGGTGDAYAVGGIGGNAANEQIGMTSPVGGSCSFSPAGNCTGSIATRNAPGIYQDVESARTLAGRSSTFSLWLWTGSGTVTITNIIAAQIFGTGGSPSPNTVVDTSVNWVVTTTPQRFSVRVDWPSVVGKTFGTTVGTDFFQIGIWLPPANAVNVGTSQWQLEQTSARAPAIGIPTTFEYRGQQAELARVQRYYQKGTVNSLAYAPASGQNISVNAIFAVQPRAVPAMSATSIFNSNTNTTINVQPSSDSSGALFYTTTTATLNAQSQFTATYTADARL